eukprot:symbB.v1.2.022055.t2/scaffold1941.1/size95522/1
MDPLAPTLLDRSHGTLVNQPRLSGGPDGKSAASTWRHHGLVSGVSAASAFAWLRTPRHRRSARLLVMKAVSLEPVEVKAETPAETPAAEAPEAPAATPEVKAETPAETPAAEAPEAPAATSEVKAETPAEVKAETPAETPAVEAPEAPAATPEVKAETPAEEVKAETPAETPAAEAPEAPAATPEAGSCFSEAC